MDSSSCFGRVPSYPTSGKHPYFIQYNVCFFGRVGLNLCLINQIRICRVPRGTILMRHSVMFSINQPLFLKKKQVPNLKCKEFSHRVSLACVSAYFCSKNPSWNTLFSKIIANNLPKSKNQPKCQNLFHKDSSPCDLYIMTLVFPGARPESTLHHFTGFFQ